MIILDFYSFTLPNNSYFSAELIPQIVVSALQFVL